MLLAYVRCFYLNVISPFAQLRRSTLPEISFEESSSLFGIFLRTDFLRCFLPHFVFSSWPWRTLPCECPLISNKFFFCFSFFRCPFFLPFSMSAREHIIVSPTRRYHCRFCSERGIARKNMKYSTTTTQRNARVRLLRAFTSTRNCKSILFIQQWTNTWNFNGVVIVMINPGESEQHKKRFLQGEHNGSKKGRWRAELKFHDSFKSN